MKFGLGVFSCDLLPADDRTHPQAYEEMLDAAQVAEQNNFDSVWTTEHHFTEGGYMPSVTTSMAALAAVTDDVTIGSNIALGPLYKQPVRLAEDLATIDIISDGRLHFAVGNGYRREEFRGFNIPTSERPGRLTELIEILRAAWTEDSFTYKGEFFQYEDVSVTPKPVQDPAPPITVAGIAPPAVRRAARIGDGYTFGSMMDFYEIQGIVDIYREEVEEQGRDLDQQTLLMMDLSFLHAEKDPYEVVKEGWEHLTDQYGRWYHNAGMIESPEAIQEAFDESEIFFSSPESMIERIERFQEALGDNLHFMYSAVFPGVPYEDLKHSIELFGQQVIPHFR